jgi:hypothetical protein
MRKLDNAPRERIVIPGARDLRGNQHGDDGDGGRRRDARSRGAAPVMSLPGNVAVPSGAR